MLTWYYCSSLWSPVHVSISSRRSFYAVGREGGRKDPAGRRRGQHCRCHVVAYLDNSTSIPMFFSKDVAWNIVLKVISPRFLHPIARKKLLAKATCPFESKIDVPLATSVGCICWGLPVVWRDFYHAFLCRCPETVVTSCSMEQLCTWWGWATMALQRLFISSLLTHTEVSQSARSHISGIAEPQALLAHPCVLCSLWAVLVGRALGALTPSAIPSELTVLLGSS